MAVTVLKTWRILRPSQVSLPLGASHGIAGPIIQQVIVEAHLNSVRHLPNLEDHGVVRLTCSRAQYDRPNRSAWNYSVYHYCSHDQV